MRQRAALSQPPTFQTINEKQDAYVDAIKLRSLVRTCPRYWSFHSMPTTVALDSGRFAKSLNGFADHMEEASFLELLREYGSFGVPRPSGYADVFHEQFKSPRVKWSTNAVLAPCLAGGWQAALVPGVHKGTFRKYDIRSAYLWASTLGMPNSATYHRSKAPWKKKDGIFRIRLLRKAVDAPFPFNQAREVLATNLEIETYNLAIGEVIDGVTWDGLIDPAPILSAIKTVSTWKQAARAYWGRWGQSQKITCHSKGKTWELPNISLNVPWAHIIISRVRMRLWEFSSHALHVFIDSVITPEQLPTGNELGDWRLEKTYDGVFIRGPGQYGALNESRLERMVGRAKDSPERDISAALASAVKRSNGETSCQQDAKRKNYQNSSSSRTLDKWLRDK